MNVVNSKTQKMKVFDSVINKRYCAYEFTSIDSYRDGKYTGY